MLTWQKCWNTCFNVKYLSISLIVLVIFKIRWSTRTMYSKVATLHPQCYASTTTRIKMAPIYAVNYCMTLWKSPLKAVHSTSHFNQSLPPHLTSLGEYSLMSILSQTGIIRKSHHRGELVSPSKSTAGVDVATLTTSTIFSKWIFKSSNGWIADSK